MARRQPGRQFYEAPYLCADPFVANDQLVLVLFNPAYFVPVSSQYHLPSSWPLTNDCLDFRAVFGSPLADERSDDEGGDEEVDSDGERADEMRSELEQEVKEKIQ